MDLSSGKGKQEGPASAVGGEAFNRTKGRRMEKTTVGGEF